MTTEWRTPVFTGYNTLLQKVCLMSQQTINSEGVLAIPALACQFCNFAVDVC